MTDTLDAGLEPPLSPCYAPPPWTYQRARLLNILCRAENAAALHRWVPAPLRPARSDGLFSMLFLHAPGIPELGPHYRSTECGILVPAETAGGKLRGSVFAVMFVDNDIAQAAGREIWGYPKKLGAVRMDETPDAISADVRHLPYRDGRGGTVFSAKVELDGSGADLPPMLAAFEPRLLRREIPDPYGAAPGTVDVMKVPHRTGRTYELRTGRARVHMAASEERFDRFGAIETLGAVFRVCDFVLPYAERI